MSAQHGGRGSRERRGNDTDQAAVLGCNDILHKEIIFYSCNQNGHCLDQCTNHTGTNLAHVGVIITQHCAANKYTWVILDTCSTNIVSNNTDLVKEIRTCKNHKKITVLTNRGLKSFNKEVTLNFFSMTVQFNKNSMKNILSFKEVEDIPGAENYHGHKSRNCNDSYSTNWIFFKFKECKSGL